jgi:hypothetical protein
MTDIIEPTSNERPDIIGIAIDEIYAVTDRGLYKSPSQRESLRGVLSLIIERVETTSTKETGETYGDSN